MHNFSDLFDKVLYRSTLHHQEYLKVVYTTIGICHVSSVGCLLAANSRQPRELAWQLPIACVQCWDTPNDGQWTCPKQVEYFFK